MAEKPTSDDVGDIGARIYTVRGQKVLTDFDLAKIYSVTTKRLNEQVKRNAKRFPDDFMFRLTLHEWEDLSSQFASSSSTNRSQIATSPSENKDLRSQNATSSLHGGRRYMPYVFTEHGAVMAANILKSESAIQMSVFVVRAFVKMRTMLNDTRDLARRLAALEKDLTERLDVHESAIVSILQRVMDVIDPPAFPEPPSRKIGFKVKERFSAYGSKGKPG